MTEAVKPGYRWVNSDHTPSHTYLLPPLFSTLNALKLSDNEKKIFDLGCGNGSVDFELDRAGWQVTGVDASAEGISQARKAFPNLNLQVGSAFEDLPSKFGQFPVCISLEVVEHLYDPKTYANNIFKLTKAGGVAILSTPFHGYLKNLTLSLLGKWDTHMDPLWDGGHIKLWSVKTISKLLTEAGFRDLQFHFVGRIPMLAKSMIVVARRPN